MTLREAIPHLSGLPAWEAVLGHLETERDSALSDFQDYELLDNPQRLARLGGEIAALDRLLRSFNALSNVPDPA